MIDSSLAEHTRVLIHLEESLVELLGWSQDGGRWLDPSGLLATVPGYARDWSAAGAVWEMLTARGWHLNLWVAPDSDCWAAAMRGNGEKAVDGAAGPEAMARAAIVALRIEQEASHA